MKTSTLLLSSATALAAVVALSGCAGSGGGSAAPTATRTTTTTETATTTPSTTATVPAADPSASTGATSGTGGGTTTAGGACSTDQLSGGTAAGTGGAAGSVGIVLTLTNTGTTTCTLQGWPGVSFVGGGDGQQIGASAVLDRSSQHDTVRLGPEGVAQIALRIAQAGNYDPATCSPKAADGFRVYPPGSTTSLFIRASGYTACAATGVHLLTTGAVVAGAAHS